MRRLIVFAAGFLFVFCTCIFAAEGPSATPAKAEPSKKFAVKPPKETRVSITGVVQDISDTMITVERTVKGKTETMGFTLDKPVEKIKAGDKVRVSYIKREDKYIAIRVTPVIAKKIIKKVAPKPAPTNASPPQK